MLLWGLVFVGLILLILGIYHLVKNYKNGKYIKGYGLISYIGFGMILLGGILLNEPFFTSLPGNLPKVVPLAIVMFSTIIIGQLLLKPTFLRKKR